MSPILFGTDKPEWWGYLMVKNKDMFSGVDSILECDGQTDGQTNGHLATA